MKIIFCIIVTLSAVAGTAADIRYTVNNGERYVYLRDIAGHYNMKIAVWQNGSSLSSKSHQFSFKHDKRECSIDSVKVNLMFASFNRGSHAFISEKDFLLFFDPLLRPDAVKNHKMTTIMIDPGHGGKDQGCRGKVILEKDLVLKIARKVRDELTRRNYRVIMTRNSDRDLSLQSRTALCARYRPDIFVSIHANSTGTRSVDGIETFVLAPAGTTSTYGKKTAPLETGNRFDKNSSVLGFELQKYLLKYTKSSDRGLKRARFYVLKHASCPAALVEVGFLSKRAEEIRLSTEWLQNQIAIGITAGIISYHRHLQK